MITEGNILDLGLANLQMVKNFSFEYHTVGTTTQLCHCIIKCAADNV